MHFLPNYLLLWAFITVVVISLGQILVMQMAAFSIWFKFSQVSDPGPLWLSSSLFWHQCVRMVNLLVNLLYFLIPGWIAILRLALLLWIELFIMQLAFTYFLDRIPFVLNNLCLYKMINHHCPGSVRHLHRLTFW